MEKPSLHSIDSILTAQAQIPAITYGGPDVPPDQPSPESAKIPESVVILEFLADIFPDSGLLPSSPVERAKVRLFIDAVDTRFQGPLFGFLTKGDTSEALTTALEQVQSFLPAGSEFAVGNHFTIADAALLPLLTSLNVILNSQHGGFKISERDHVLKEYQSERFEKIRSYFEKNKAKRNFQQAVAKEVSHLWPFEKMNNADSID